MAEGFFRRLLGNRKDIEVASAGVHAVRGQPPSMHAVHVCEQEGVDIRGLRSQPLTATLVDRATHIFAMTGGPSRHDSHALPPWRGEGVSAPGI